MFQFMDVNASPRCTYLPRFISVGIGNEFTAEQKRIYYAIKIEGEPKQEHEIRFKALLCCPERGDKKRQSDFERKFFNLTVRCALFKRRLTYLLWWTANARDKSIRLSVGRWGCCVMKCFSNRFIRWLFDSDWWPFICFARSLWKVSSRRDLFRTNVARTLDWGILRL